MKNLSIILLLVLAIGLGLNGVRAHAADDQDVVMLEQLRKMRVKQQGEEGPVRIQHFITQQSQSQCTPVQQARQRLRDLEADDDEGNAENVNITAGHGELNVTDNHGTINSDINVQIVKQGEGNECL